MRGSNAVTGRYLVIQIHRRCGSCPKEKTLIFEGKALLRDFHELFHDRAGGKKEGSLREWFPGGMKRLLFPPDFRAFFTVLPLAALTRAPRLCAARRHRDMRTRMCV